MPKPPPLFTQYDEDLGDRLNGKGRPDTVAREVAGKREEWLARWQAKLRSDERPINPYRVISEFIAKESEKR